MAAATAAISIDRNLFRNPDDGRSYTIKTLNHGGSSSTSIAESDGATSSIGRHDDDAMHPAVWSVFRPEDDENLRLKKIPTTASDDDARRAAPRDAASPPRRGPSSLRRGADWLLPLALLALPAATMLTPGWGATTVAPRKLAFEMVKSSAFMTLGKVLAMALSAPAAAAAGTSADNGGGGERARALARFAAWGLIRGALNLCWYSALPDVAAAVAAAALGGGGGRFGGGATFGAVGDVLLKTALDQLLFTPLNTIALLLTIAVFEGSGLAGPRGGAAAARARLGGMLVAGWRVWPAVHAANFALVPAGWRLTVVYTVGIAMNATLALLMQQPPPPSAAAKAKVA